MSPHTGTTIRPYRDKHPRIDRTAIVLDGVRIIGDVTLGPGSSLWYNTVVRGDVHWVRIGSDTNVQDGSILHVTREDFPLSLGSRVTVGHGVCLHGCTIHDEALIGMGSTVLDGAVVESRSMVAAGALVPPGMVVREGTLVGGVPARVLRPLREEEILDLPESARRYCGYARDHAAVMPW
ncbi:MULTISPECIES: gamma carbonic anhydrase family protein [Alkalispirochaeta]|uniref:gamma carbonic anhydrase family protein n=1 Tax=Alkalispirochaeta TaxID=2024958 RepID=UPI00037463BD|nr:MULTISPECIES: gamma carbonic anhydrase family protein [Alkalispirochaeta]